MKTRLRLLNVLLVVACGFVAWQMRANQIDHEARLDRTFSVRAQQVAAGETVIDPLPSAPKPADYSQVAMRMLFAQDRNPTVVEEKKPEPPPKKMPELPVLHGVMDLGDGAIAMMSPKNGDAQGTYKVGDTIGEFEIVKIATDRITFRWEGKEVTKLSAELRGSGERPAPRSAKTPATPAAAAPAPAAPAAPVKPGPGRDLGGTSRACQPGDKSPDGTIVDGYMKRTARTPMGPVCNWVPVEKN